MVLFSCTEEGSQTVNKVASRPSVPILASTVTIGTQVWMTRNLNVSKHRDGTPIPQVTNSSQWANLTTGAWCYYANNTGNGTVYGKLYNWSAVAGIHDAASAANPTLRKKLAPTGYHVPSDVEWNTLINFLGGENVAGNKMKASTGWIPYPGVTNTNSRGFTALPGGYFDYFGFSSIPYYGYLWSSTDYAATYAWMIYLNHSNGKALSYYFYQSDGLSVRCLRD